MTDEDVTKILQAAAGGDATADDRLFTVVYDELRSIAQRFMAGERGDHTLQATAVVHEAYLRLIGDRQPQWESRAHFFGAAAEAMRRILIDHARRKASRKRGGGRRRLELTDVAQVGESALDDLIALDQGLDRLEGKDPMMAAVVKLRYFAGLSVEQTASALNTSPRSVNRAWTAARAWLRREIGRLPDADRERAD